MHSLLDKSPILFEKGHAMRTKIIATIGPASDNTETLHELIHLGVRVFRLNFSHGDADSFAPLVERLHGLEKELLTPLTLLQDLSGPKMRIGELARSPLHLSPGDHALLGPPGAEPPPKASGEDLPYFSLDFPEVLAELEPGDALALSDGGLGFTAVERQGQALLLQARNQGIVTSRKGIAFPGKALSIKAVTDKDRKDLAEGIALGLDAAALSYVQRAEDIYECKELAAQHGKPHLPVVAKLERQNAVNDLERIVAAADAVMVARGDLGLECPLHTLPGLQKRIIRTCNMAAKPVIVATQMLLSMVESPMPTRAETTDVANAVLDGADCLMLSEETAVGRFPAQAVSYMERIGAEAERLRLSLAPMDKPVMELATACGEEATGPRLEEGAVFLAYGACLLAEKTGAAALVAHSVSGSTARLLAAHRPRQPIYGLSPDSRVRHTLNLSWGVTPQVIPEEPEDHLERAQIFVDHCPEIASGQRAVITAGQPRPGERRSETNVVKLYRKQ